MKCQENHETIWKSNCKHYSVGNLISAASVLSSGNTYQRLACFFDLTGLQWTTKTSYAIQNHFLLGNSKQRLYKEVLHNIRGDEKK